MYNDSDSFDIGDAHIKILHQPNPACTEEFINNASVVYRITVAGQTLLFPGDLATAEGHAVLQKYRSALKCDIIQMAHHGQNGVRRDFYEAAAPRACFWDTPLWLWNNDIGQGFNTHIWETVTVRRWMTDLGVKFHFIAKDGDCAIPLPYPFDPNDETNIQP